MNSDVYDDINLNFGNLSNHKDLNIMGIKHYFPFKWKNLFIIH